MDFCLFMILKYTVASLFLTSFEERNEGHRQERAAIIEAKAGLYDSRIETIPCRHYD